MSWAVAVAAKKKAEASLSSASIAQLDSMSYVEKAARKVLFVNRASAIERVCAAHAIATNVGVR